MSYRDKPAYQAALKDLERKWSKEAKERLKQHKQSPEGKAERAVSLKAILIMLVIVGACMMLGPVIGGALAVILTAGFLILVIVTWGARP